MLKVEIKTESKCAGDGIAIVVDQKSYDEAKSEIDAYRTSIEKEGLGTYLLIDDWKRPEPIREQLVKLHENEKTPLEGCVFIGDIPIPMIRDAHHLSSAFKRSPKANWQKSRRKRRFVHCLHRITWRSLELMEVLF